LGKRGEIWGQKKKKKKGTSPYRYMRLKAPEDFTGTELWSPPRSADINRLNIAITVRTLG